MSDLIFYVNGKKVVKNNPNPSTVLAEYLRKELKLTGTKIGCGEGACGACTVLISRFDRATAKIIHYSATSCIVPICMLHGTAVTTVEAIGSMRTKQHPIQERLAVGHGVQCGFCSPGMVMSMYALLRNNPKPTELQIEHAIKGNLCRCTGYRPILDAFRSFAQENNSCPMGALCCKNKPSQDVEAVEDCPSDHELCDKTQDLIFPSELQLSDELDQSSLTFGSEKDILWRRPVSLTELLSLKRQHPGAVLSAGNSSVVFNLNKQRAGKEPIVVIATTAVRELREYHVTDDDIYVGAQTSIAQLEQICTDLNKRLPESKCRLIKALLNILNVFGAQQIKNQATVGGSLVLASRSADVNAVLLVGNCTVKLASLAARRQVQIGDFFTGPQHTCVEKDEVLLGVKIPFSTENDFYGSFKQSPRRDLCLADINAAIGIRLGAGSDVIESISLSVGGEKLPSLKRINGVNKVVGKKLDRQILETVLPEIIIELDCEPAASEDNRYKLLSLQGFLQRFYLEVSDKLQREKDLSESDELYLSLSAKKGTSIHSGVQAYHLEKPVSDTDAVGQPVVHRFAKQCTTGEAVFTDDILPSEGELYVSLVASTRASARLVNVDTSAALALPGVVGYIDHTFVKGSNEIGMFVKVPVFAIGEVHHVGQTIGAIVATSERLARQGASLVKVEYEDLPAIFTIEEALENKSFHFCFPGMDQINRGDVDAAFKSAAHVVENQVSIGSQEHFYMETNSARVVPKGEDDEFEIYLGTQGPFMAQTEVAQVLNIPASKITVHMKRMGGAFGGKLFRTQLATIPSALAAQKFGRPTRCTLNRHEDMERTGHRRPYLFKYKVGFTDSGEIVALDANVYANDGYYPDLAVMLMNHTLMYSDNCYFIPNIRLRGHLCKTNLQSRCAMRGAGVPQAIFFAENVIRDVAASLKKPVLEIQQLNLLRHGKNCIGNPPWEPTLERCVEDVLKQSDYEAECQRIEEFNKNSKHIKRGIGMVPVRFSPALPLPFGQGTALVHIYLDGSVLLAHGGSESGQGLNTKMVQIASRVLGAPIDIIHHSETSTNTVPNATPTGGSTGSDLNGMAVLNTCTVLAERLQPFKQAKPEGTWTEWVNAAYAEGVGLSFAGHWKTSLHHSYNPMTDEGESCQYTTFGAGVTRVELDCLTGQFTIPKVDIVMDIGKSLNPAIDVGQIEGGFVMGLGFFTVENHQYDAEGKLVTVGAGKYKVPTVSSIPLQMNVTMLKDSTNPSSEAIYSSKGIGEPPLLTSNSVFFALKEAIASARVDAGLPAQFRLNSPATVSKILLATHSAEH